MSVPTFEVQQWLEASLAQGQQFTPVVRPKILGCWSKDSSTLGGRFHFGSLEGMSYFKRPSKLPVSLDQGFPDAYVKKDDGEASPVEQVIRGVKQSGADLTWGKICTFRNNLNKILNTPLKPLDEWSIDACHHNGTLFLDIVKTPQRDFPNSDLFTFYGYKFEAICTGGEGAVVDASSEFALLVRLQLGPHRIIMAAEVDCASPGLKPADGSACALPSDTAHFMELKTAKLHHEPRARQRNLAQKYPSWWVQSFLAGIPTIVVGGRDDGGMLTEVFEVPVAELPSKAAAAGQPFDAWQLLQFGDEVLSWMMKLCEASPQQQLRFKYCPSRDQRHISCSVMEDGLLPARLHRELGT